MDRIANFIITLKNGNIAGKEKVHVPHSKLLEQVAELLKKEGYVKAVRTVTPTEGAIQKYLEIVLCYDELKNAKIREVARVSKSSRRVYKGVKEIGVFKRGQGLIVLTTPKGILSEKEAKKEHVGGEVLFKIF